MSSFRRLELCFLIFLWLLCPPAQAKSLYPEKAYQDFYCPRMGGWTEAVLPDRTRVDCLTDEYAIEFEFARKWAEAVGQALHYARMTKRKPGIAVIVESPGDERYVRRLIPLCRKYKIKLWIVEQPF